MNIDKEARELKERIRDALNDFQRNTNYKLRPSVDVDVIGAGSMGEGDRFIIGDVVIRIEAEY